MGCVELIGKLIGEKSPPKVRGARNLGREFRGVFAAENPDGLLKLFDF